MAVALSAPHFKPSADAPNIQDFVKQLESLLEVKQLPYYLTKGNAMKEMLDLASSDARGTAYNKELSAALNVSDLHIELRAYDFSTNADWSDSDFVLGELINYTDDEILNRFENTIANLSKVDIVEVLPIGHYSTALSELVYDVPSIVLYVNVDSMELYPSVAEGITDIIAYYEDRKTS
jgi:hypothetical protein